MDFEEWYVKLGEWADENTALNMSYAMQRHLARRLAEWEKAAEHSVHMDACPACKGKRYVLIGAYHEVCEICHGTGKRQ